MNDPSASAFMELVKRVAHRGRYQKGRDVSDEDIQFILIRAWSKWRMA